jgi:antitoxin ParD1/3/4
MSKVKRAGLRLLEDDESRSIALKQAIQKGLESPRVENFNFDENLTQLVSPTLYKLLNLEWNN